MGEPDRIIDAIDQRLSRLAEEKELLERLRTLYLGGGVELHHVHTNGNHADQRNRIGRRLPDTSKPGGATETILAVVAKEPGLTAAQMIDAVVARNFNSQSKHPRRAIAQTASFLVSANRLLKQEGRFYPVLG